MTETVCFVMPAAMLAAPTPSPAGRRGTSGARDFARDAAASLATAEAELRKAEVRALARADARASTSTEAIVARARALMAESGSALNVIEDVDRVRAEAASFASKSMRAREHEAWQRRREQRNRLDETMGDTGLALERRLMAHAHELIAAARRAITDDPLQAHELAIRAREAMAAIGALCVQKPDHKPARRILQGARGRNA